MCVGKPKISPLTSFIFHPTSSTYF